MADLVSLQGLYEGGILNLKASSFTYRNAKEGIMQAYYNKKAKECEAAVAQLQQQIERMSSDDAASLQEQMNKVRREMKNYQAALGITKTEASVQS
ncbi:MAG: putative nuclease of restriction endonuclease-like (RecB) superfamily [Oleispira sp.]|jgi:predicted nuclease of restriction endonuclease-like (RecB) superfamily